MKRNRLKFLACFTGVICFLISYNTLKAQNVGINNNAPTEKLDVRGNVQLSGALMPSGNAGTVDLALTSGGGGLAPMWASATQGQHFYFFTSINPVTLNKGSLATVIPGLTKSVIVPATGSYDVWIYNDGMADWFGTLSTTDFNRSIYPEISIWIDGVNVKSMVFMLDNANNVVDNFRPWNISYNGPLTAGTHTIAIKARIYKCSSWMSVNKSRVIFGAASNNTYNFSYLVVGLIKK